ncbi:hypothetical protein tb265_47130 [Gemmatimonadetes bacterium T265]|nr:hypothetical protein tb265_47130 [Gemmatimonadetes bacterium T265]
MPECRAHAPSGVVAWGAPRRSITRDRHVERPIKGIMGRTERPASAGHSSWAPPIRWNTERPVMPPRQTGAYPASIRGPHDRACDERRPARTGRDVTAYSVGQSVATEERRPTPARE